MALIPSNLPNQITLSQSQSATPLNRLFTLGQILTANIQPINQNEARLTVGQHSFIAKTPVPVSDNGQIQVKVKQLTPELQLTIVKPGSPEAKAPQQQVIQNAYRQFIPSQMPLSQTFQQINLLQSLPPNVQLQLQTLANQLLKQENNLSGKSIKQKILDSGLFMEAKIRNNPSQNITQALKNDVKAQLLQLQSQVNTQASQASQSSAAGSLNKLSELLSQALSRITVQQVQLIENPNITPLIQLNESNQEYREDKVEIRRRAHEDKQEWEVYINLELELGEFMSKLVLDEENNLNCFIWCSSDDLKTEVEKFLNRLENNLALQSFNQVQVQLVPAKIETSKESVKVALIDIKV